MILVGKYVERYIYILIIYKWIVIIVYGDEEKFLVEGLNKREDYELNVSIIRKILIVVFV